MDALSISLASALNYGLKAVKSATASQSSQAKGSAEFDTTLKALLGSDSASKVSEEEVFSALIQERIGKMKGEESLSAFKGFLAESKERLRKPDGFIPIEDATKDALRRFRDAGKISAEEADSAYSQAFAGAQLDANKNALYDNRGGPGDSTMAVAAMEEALLSSRTQFAAFDDGSATAEGRSLDEASAGKVAPSLDSSGSSSEISSGGFLFKPVSDSDGRLAILLPPKLAGLVSGVRLIGPNGKEIEAGRFSGNGNGGRDHYRFSRAGGEYPDGLRVEVTLKTNELIRYFIKETSQRNENVSPEKQGGGPTTDSETSSGGQSSGDNSRADNSL